LFQEGSLGGLDQGAGLISLVLTSSMRAAIWLELWTGETSQKTVSSVAANQTYSVLSFTASLTLAGYCIPETFYMTPVASNTPWKKRCRVEVEIAIVVRDGIVERFSLHTIGMK
jgi:hypothetical protein